VRAYLEEKLLRGPRGRAFACLFSCTRSLFNSAAGKDTSVEFSIDIDSSLDRRHILLQGIHWYLEFPMPALPLMLRIDLGLSSEVIRTSRVQALIADAHVADFLEDLRVSTQNLDLRELDHRLSGFAEPLHVEAETWEVDWLRPDQPRLKARNIRCSLHLPE